MLPHRSGMCVCLQVYNENIRDLLNDTGEFLDLREDPIKVSLINPCIEAVVDSLDE